MARLDDAIYPILVKLASGAPVPFLASNRLVTYQDLCDVLPLPWTGMYCRSRKLHRALGNLVRRCRAAGLPALSALVINSKRGWPGNGFFAIATPGVDSAGRKSAWLAECSAIYAANYPAALP